MNETSVQGLLTIARLHIHHLKKSQEQLQHMMPLTPVQVEDFDDDDITVWDAFTIRFCKLQDLMGAKLFDAVLSLAGKDSPTATIIDKVNVLEKLHIIEDASIWMQMRNIRNSLTHEYPDAPTFTAQTLNAAFQLSYALYQIIDNIERYTQ